ncbi:site-specific DNA recombinase [Cytobacillus purgationiresistens]|uniref:Site-specific DNA recombinase n=1 Tax=Cytobacillus purgationiresistens TaxID=863449 RepID=A0ABU0ACF1_9BACI|nr:site-specific DNA recombinase [Cytobacillus purgationiresistens]
MSTEEQAKHGYSIAAQQEKLEAFCLSQGWEISNIYIDDGYSAKDLNRLKFNIMMEEIRKGGIDVLLVYRLDRLTRSVVDLYSILKILDEYNCNFKSATEVYDTTNAMGRLFITLVAAIAQWERENLAERVRLGMEKKAKLGLWKGGTPPYGYKLEEKKLVINHKEEKVVKEIFNFAARKGFYSIAKILTDKGYPTRSGNNWHVDSVRDIANNPTYAGYLTFSESIKEYKKKAKEKKLIEGKHPRIIEREDFWELQNILEKRKGSGSKRETSNYYFSSILKCARCGHSMSGHKSGQYKTYRCSGKKAGKKCSSHIILEKNLVTTVFSEFKIENFYNKTEAEDVSIDKVENIEREIKHIEKLINKQKEMFEKDIIDIDELIQKTEHLRLNEKKLAKELKHINQNAIENTDEITFLIENIDSLWKHADESEKKQIMNTLFDQIVIDTKEDYNPKHGAREIVIVSMK